MTPQEWDVHWHRIRDDYRNSGAQPLEADIHADLQTAEEFGPRPQETP